MRVVSHGSVSVEKNDENDKGPTLDPQDTQTHGAKRLDNELAPDGGHANSEAALMLNGYTRGHETADLVNSKSTPTKTVTINEPRTSPSRQRSKRRSTGFFRTLFSCGGSCGGAGLGQHHHSADTRASLPTAAGHSNGLQPEQQASTSRGGGGGAAPVSHLHNFLDELGSYMEKANRKVKIINDLRANIMSHHLHVGKGHQRSASNHETSELPKSRQQQQQSAPTTSDDSKPTISDYNRKLSHTSTEDLLKKTASKASTARLGATANLASDHLNNDTDVDDEEENESRNDEENEEYEEDEEEDEEDDEEEEQEEEEDGGITDGDFVDDEDENLSNEEADCDEYGGGRAANVPPPDLTLPDSNTGAVASSQDPRDSADKSEQVPSFSFEEFNKDLQPPPALRLDDDPYDDDGETTRHEEQQQPAKQQKSTADYFSKFLTPNNILTDRGCIVNLRTGSFNLGCQQSGSCSNEDNLNMSLSGTSTEQDSTAMKPAPLLLSSLSQQPILGAGSHRNEMTSSLSFHLGRSSSPLSDRLVNDFSPRSNMMDEATSGSSNLVLIPYILIRSRQKITDDYETDEYSKTTPTTLPASGEAIAKSVSTQISRIVAATPQQAHNDGRGSAKSSFLSANASGMNPSNLNAGGGGGAGSFLGVPDQQDQRRCSHDPNIEKLHKNYINNVKLNAVAPTSSISVSTTTTTDSASNMQVQSCGSAQTVSSVGSAAQSVPTIKKSGSKKVKKDTAAASGTPGDGLTRKESRKSQRASDDKSGNAVGGGGGDMKGMDSEESDVVNDITKVSKWLKDNKNHHNRRTSDGKDSVATAAAKKTTVKSTETVAAAHAHNMSVSSSNQEEDDDEDNDEISGRTTTDSAIEADQYGSVSTLSKTSSGKSRVNWPSFTKYYHAHFFQSIDTTWSKYQISAMSLEQIMALRKLALIDFSKLLEQQHSLLKQIFSKRRGIDEFKRVYESIDSINNGSASSVVGPRPDSQQQLRHNKAKSHSSSKKDTDNSVNLSGGGGASSHLTSSAQGSAQQRDSIIIDKRKVSHQLGAQIGAHPNTNVALQNRKKRNKHSLKKQEQQLLFEKNQMQLRHRLGNSQQIVGAADLPSCTDPVSSSEQPADVAAPDLNAAVLDNPTASSVSPASDASKPPKPTTRVFGLPLSTIMQQTGQPLPQRILEAMRYLRKIGSNEVGIFRKNGVKTRINRLKELIDLNEPIHFQSNEYNVYDIADTVKLYFRELPECLITNKLSDILLSNYSSIQIEQRKSVLQQLMLLIPDENRLVLQTLLLFLSEIAKHDKKNQMTLNNLAVCFSPVIFHLNVDAKLKLKPKRFSTKLKSSKTPSQQKEASPIETSTSVQAKLSIVAASNINQSKSNPHLAEKNAESLSAASDSPSNVVTGLVGSSSFTFNDGGGQRSSNNSLQDSQLSTIVNNESASTTNEQHTSKSSLNSAQTPSQLLMTSNTNLQQTTASQMKTLNVTSSSTTMSKTANYKRKASDTINKAASSLVHFSTGLTELTSSSTSNAFFSTSSSSSSKATDNFQIMSKVVQQCVADMIQYSMDLFTVPVENFEKLRLSATLSSEPRDVEYFYDQTARKLRRSEFFKSNVNIDNMFWSYLGKHEDVSIYYFKNDQVQQLKKIQQQQTQSTGAGTTGADSGKQQQTAQAPAVNTPGLQHSSSSISSVTTSLVMSTSMASSTMTAALPTCLFIPQQFENFNDRLKLWKCCTLVKCPNLTADKIMNRIKNERYLWDDDFKEGKIVELLDNDTDLYRYVINFMPPHPSRDFFEIRHWSRLEQAENPTIIITSSSMNHSRSKLVGDIRANLLISKYVIEKLAGNDTITTFKITHYVKLDYKGFSLEFYNRTFGYMMARLLYNLKQSFTSCA